MQIEVKNITAVAAPDQMQSQFEAELFLNGKPAAFITNDPATQSVRFIPRTAPDIGAIAAAEVFIQEQAQAQKTKVKNGASDLQESLALTVEMAVAAHFESINRQRFEMLKNIRSHYAILYGDPKKDSFHQVVLPRAVNSYLETPEGEKQLTDILKKQVAPKLYADDSIFNVNIPFRILRKAFPEKARQPARKPVVQPGPQQGKKH